MNRFAFVLAAAMLVVGVSTARAYPPGFIERSVAGNWDNPVGITFAPDGRAFVWERGGRVWFIENGVRQLFLDISDEVGNWGDHGMLGFALHPAFQTTGYFYVYYAVDRHHLLEHGTQNYNANTNWYFDASIARVTRYTARGIDGFRTVDPASRRILIGEDRFTGIPLLHTSHLVGSLVFSPDGTLMLSAGDSGSFVERDVGGDDGGSYAPQALIDGIITPSEDVGSYRSQLVNTMNGKVLRIDPMTGDGVPSNPFYDAAEPRAPRSRVWSLGLRNPFRMTHKPNTGSHNRTDGDPGTYYIGDVGWTLWEELHVADAPGQNFGWPVYDGMTIQQSYVNLDPGNPDAINPLAGGSCEARVPFSSLIIQDTLNPNPVFPNPCDTGVALPNTFDLFVHARPAIDWHHNQVLARVPGFNGANPIAQEIGNDAPVTGSPFLGSSSTGGVWYTGTNYPAEYQDTYFHADFAGQWVRHLIFDSGDNLTEVRDFELNAGNVVDLAVHPTDGELYIVSLFPSEIVRIEYTPTGNQPPVVQLTSDVTYGPTPLTVQFDATGSFDPEDETLAYTWDFGDGPFGSGPTRSHTFNAPAGVPTQFDVTLIVTDPGGETEETNMTISVNNTPPQVQITSPIDGAVFDSTSASIVDLNAIISDAEFTNGELTCEWQTILHHNDHFHPEVPDNNCDTTAVLPPVGCDDNETYFYAFTLTVTDPAGLSTTERVELQPDCGNGIELRLVSTGLDEGPVVVTPSQDSIDLYVQARVYGDPTATGLVTFDGTIQDDGSGAFAPAPLTMLEATGIDLPGLDPSGRTGMFPSYRATIADDNTDLGNGAFYNQAWNILPLNLSFSGNGEGLNGEWANVYKLNWTTADLSERDIQLNLDASFGGYQSLSGIVEPVQVVADNLLIHVQSDACPCDYDGNGLVEVLDLLTFLAIWFTDDLAADYDNSGAIDTLDLLAFLACWFPATDGVACP